MPGAVLDSTPSVPGSLALLEQARDILLRFSPVPFYFFDLSRPEPRLLTDLPGIRPDQLERLGNLLGPRVRDGEVRVQAVSENLQVLVIPFGTEHVAEFAALGFFAVQPWDEWQPADQRDDWLDAVPKEDQVPYCHPELLRGVGEAVRASIASGHQLRGREGELIQLASQVSRNYEEITLLHQLTRDAHVRQGTREVQDLAISLLAGVLPAQQVAYVDARYDRVLFGGSRLLDAVGCRELIRRLQGAGLQRPIVENHLVARKLAQGMGCVGRVVIVPVHEGDAHFGWVMAINPATAPELGSVEASLMNAVSAILATHQTNVSLLQNTEDLFLGVVRALSSAIDAKDPYTCGHSERVGRVARRIGQKLGLPEGEVNRIYLSGLLHDVGKIGIRDSVLLKPGRLTPEEFEHIKEHPRIGYEILCTVRQLEPILPGVRNHHENYDGTGYPDGLKATNIPLMARIIAVADSYDAMNSNRPYRRGMSKELIEEVFRDGVGRQWDGDVVVAFLGLHEKIRRELNELGQLASLDTPLPTRRNDSGGLLDPPDLRQILRFVDLVAE